MISSKGVTAGAKVLTGRAGSVTIHHVRTLARRFFEDAQAPVAAVEAKQA